MMEEKSALILGSTGLTGNALTSILPGRDLYSRIILPVRKSQGRTEGIVEEVEIDMKNMSGHKELFAVDDVFCCLGTTMKSAGSREAFREVDYHYPLEAARMAKEMGAARFFIITALGSDPDSKIFYNRTKGEVERDLEKLDFEALHLFRPSLLVGKRKEARIKEDLANILFKGLGFLMAGPLKKYRAIEGDTVARAMAEAATGEEKGCIIHSSGEMQQWAGGKN